jgi:GNAT superfamily N-acetyltransferase
VQKRRFRSAPAIHQHEKLVEIVENGFLFSDDKQKLNVHAIHHYLSTKSYWAKNIPIETVKTSIDNSLCFGVYKDSEQIGFGRWITDCATFGYLADVYILEDFRGMALAKKMMSLMLFHKDLQGLRRYMLATLDAHDLYSQFGFKPIENPDALMAIVIKDAYL